MSIYEDTLYKYRSYSARSLELLIKRKLYFASPSNLNDPYDCRINIKKSLSSAITRAEQTSNEQLKEYLNRLAQIDHVYEKINSTLGNMGILSLSRNPINTLMWSHYAEDHKGFCIGFSLSEKFRNHSESTEEIAGISDVLYKATNPYVEFFEELATSSEPFEWNEFWVQLLAVGALAKAKAWEYEEEVRVVRKKSGAVTFGTAELTEIIFGLNMSSSERDTIKAILSGDGWEHVKYRAITKSDGFNLELCDET